MAVDPAGSAALRRAGFLRFVPGLTLAVFLGPVAAGLFGTLLPAFGYLPALGGDTVSLAAWRDLAAYPGVLDATLRSFGTGLASAAISFVLVTLFCAASFGTRWFGRVRAVLAPLLAVPHAALAMGLAFLLAPSGWILRALSPWLTGYDRPPDLMLAPDPYGWSLVLALVVKEVPFLFLMTVGALNQVPADRSIRVAQSLGYDRMSAWLKTVLPRIYGQIRLPVFAIVAFSVSVVDVAMILTVTPSPTLGVLILRWANDPDLTLQFQAAAGACLQGGVVLAALAAWILAERAVARIGLAWIRIAGRRMPMGMNAGALAGLCGAALLGMLGLMGLAVWSFARRWRFPDMLPAEWTLSNWTRRIDQIVDPLLTTVWLGAASAAIALFLVLLCLEAEQRTGRRPTNRALWLLYTPLIVPQVAFLFGAQVLLVSGGMDGHWVGLVWAHLLFVLPYIFLSLSDPYRALDPRYERAAACLGAGPWRIFGRVKLPMLLRPILIAFAVGFAVSVGEYLPTVFAGAGRLTTLTTEAVSLAGGGDRRTIGTLVVLQGVLPLTLFALAAITPMLVRRAAFRRGRGE
ncbi:MAG: ABC transporter permease subunit [Alphaproteobacteria bacterium]|nr:ABC transporter permease subunit [Alphaproteobacteria bacterium]